MIGAIAALAALIAASWRATPDQTDVAVILYVIGGLLEGAGVVTIGLDLLRRHRRRHAEAQASAIKLRQTLKEMAEAGDRDPLLIEVNEAEARLMEAEDAAEPAVDLDPRVWPLRVEHRLAWLEWRVEVSERVPKYDPVRFRFPDSDAVAWVGFVALLLGVLVGTVANILSATA